MNYFFRFLFSLVFLLIFTACNSDSAPTKTSEEFFAVGGVDGGGGTGVMCGDQVSTLDLFEAQSSGLDLQTVSDDLDENIKYFGAKVSLHFALESGPADIPTPGIQSRADFMLKVMKKEIVSKFRDIPDNQRLAFFSDATLPSLPTNCHFVQLAYYDDGTNTLYRDPRYWSKMDVRNQTALIIHEYVYRRARRFKIKNSDETRKLIGHFFSLQPLEPLLSPLWNLKDNLWCTFGSPGRTDLFEFYGKEETRGGQLGVAFYFDLFKNIFLTTRMSAFFPGYTLDQFTGGHFQKNTGSLAIQRMVSRDWVIEFSKDYESAMSGFRAYSKNSEIPRFSAGGCEKGLNSADEN